MHRWLTGLLALVVAFMAVPLGASSALAAAQAKPDTEQCAQLYEDSPCLVFSPKSASPGSLVTFTGDIDDNLKQWKRDFGRSSLRGMYGNFLEGGPTGDACELLVGLHGFKADVDTTTGEVSGSFTLGKYGNCKQEERTYPAYPGTYYLTAGCLSCAFAEYQVTAAESAKSSKPADKLPRTGANTLPLVAMGLMMCVAGAAVVVGWGRRPYVR